MDVSKFSMRKKVAMAMPVIVVLLGIFFYIESKLSETGMRIFLIIMTVLCYFVLQPFIVWWEERHKRRKKEKASGI